MISKEKIVEIINKYLWKFDVDKLADELFEEFEKDLVVLEIIKKHTHSMEVTMPNNKIKILGYAIPKGSLNEKEIKIIKEWMENGSNNK